MLMNAGQGWRRRGRRLLTVFFVITIALHFGADVDKLERPVTLIQVIPVMQVQIVSHFAK